MADERASDGFGTGPLSHELWLDKSLALSCGLWADATDLETAQLNKYRLMARWAGVTADSRVLDVGSGFGGMLRHLSEEHGVAAACGLDLSGEACQAAREPGLRGVTVRQGDYRAFTPAEPYDAVVSIGFLENLAGAEESDRQPELCREFFERTHTWTRPGARLGIETTILGHSRDWGQEGARYAEAMRRLRLTGALLRLDQFLRTCDPWWEPVHVTTHRDDYARTFSEWADRLRACRQTAESTGHGQEIANYLDFTTNGVALFDRGTLSVAHLGLRRVDRP
ncbi:class I SAM-dependent methyltransferase [Streptosporangium sp. NPDC051023]|uniref:SAM-dependent methyltransferase n=1 Tax=Streptosporangium sp. NPDC051023 TaxID=3155410 RepID=UPI00344C13A6